nr:H/ACA ribonucleoprotein complex subunit 1-like [Aegilops tauschii subsp. strangulata]
MLTQGGGWNGGRHAFPGRSGGFGRGGGRFGIGNGVGRGFEEEDSSTEGNGENLIWQAKTGKKEAGEETIKKANGDAGVSGLEKDRNKEQLVQSDQNQQQKLPTSLLSQLVQGMKNSEKDQIEEMFGKHSGNQPGEDGQKKEERGGEGQQRADKGFEQNSGMELKKQGGETVGNGTLRITRKDLIGSASRFVASAKTPDIPPKNAGWDTV